MKWLSIVGARPQFVKLAPLTRTLALQANRVDDERVEHRIVHTGQHYDAAMSDSFFADLDLPEATINLGVGSATHARQTASMMSGIEWVVNDEKPDLVIVYGDTNSTLAGALVASKLGVPCAHVEAGLRSFNRRMPEEINRILVDHASDVLLAPTQAAMRLLAAEGLSERSINTGDLMHDSVLHYLPIANQRSTRIETLGLQPGKFGFVTLHRAENTDDDTRLTALLTALNEIAAQHLPLVFPVHPRTSARLKQMTGWRADPRLLLVEPTPYLDTLSLLSHSALALTDSGGLQKEAMFVGCPCITLRDETEWTETIDAGANRLVGAHPARIQEAVVSSLEQYPSGHADFSQAAAAAYGGGNAASRTLEALAQFTSITSTSHGGRKPPLAAVPGSTNSRRTYS